MNIIHDFTNPNQYVRRSSIFVIFFEKIFFQENNISHFPENVLSQSFEKNNICYKLPPCILGWTVKHEYFNLKNQGWGAAKDMILNLKHPLCWSIFFYFENNFEKV